MHICIELFSEKKPISPEKKPISPEKKPMSPEKKPISPEKKPISPEKRPMFPAKRLVPSENRPTYFEREPCLECILKAHSENVFPAYTLQISSAVLSAFAKEPYIS